MCRLTIVFLTTVLLFAGVSSSSRSNISAPDPAPDSRSPLTSDRMIYADGVVEGRGPTVELRFEIEGRLLTLAVGEGQQVTKGQILARLQPTALEIDVSKARQAVELAEAERDRLFNGASKESRELARAKASISLVKKARAQKRLLRGTELKSREAISHQEFEDLQSEAEAAEAELRAAQAECKIVLAAAREDDLAIADAKIRLAKEQLLEAENQLQKATLVAPHNGTILKTDREPGELLSAKDSKPVIVMIDHGELRVRAFVEELEAMRVSVGQQATIKADSLRDSFEGTVVFCAPVMSPKTTLRNRSNERFDVKMREVLVRIVENCDGADLVYGMPVDVYINQSQ